MGRGRGWKIEKLGVNQSIPSFNTFNYSTAVLHRVLLLTSLPRTLDTCHILPLPSALHRTSARSAKKNCMGTGREFVVGTTSPIQGLYLGAASTSVRERERENVRFIIDVIANSYRPCNFSIAQRSW